MWKIEERATLIETMPTLMSDGGIFKYLNSYYDSTPLLLGNLYVGRSGLKKIGSLVERYKGNNDTLNEEQIELLGDMIKLIFDNQWKKEYDTIIKSYDPLYSYVLNETQQTNGSNSEDIVENIGAINETSTRGGYSEQVNYGAESESNNYGEINKTNNYGERSSNTINRVSGFNNGLVDSETSGTTDNEHTDTERKSSHTDTRTTQAKTDTSTTSERNDTKTTSERENATNKSGTISENKTISKEGNVGNFTQQDLILKEIELRKYNFFNKMFSDIDSYLVLKCY